MLTTNKLIKDYKLLECESSLSFILIAYLKF